jgi:hypothetical protein
MWSVVNTGYSSGERTQSRRLSDDGRRIIVVERWLDRQTSPTRWRTRNWHRKLKANEVAYFAELAERRERESDLPKRAGKKRAA